MGVTLPNDVAYLLEMLGFMWVNTDEEQTFSKGQDWQNFANAGAGKTGEAGHGIQHVLSSNDGDAMRAFRESVEGGEDPVQTVARDMSAGSAGVGGAMYTMSGIIVALKITTVVQLVVLAVQIASAIAAAVPTAGTSMTLIPLFKIAARLAIEAAMNVTIDALMGG